MSPKEAAAKITNLIKEGKLAFTAAGMDPNADAGEGAEDASKIEGELKDGTKVIIYGDIAEGSKISVVQGDGTELPAPDGEHVMKDGTTITAKGGMIATVSAPEAQAADGDDDKFDAQKEHTSLAERVKVLEDKLNSAATENTKMAKQIEESKNIMLAMFKITEAIAGESAEDAVEQKPKTMFKGQDKINALADHLKNLNKKA